ncbi:MAG: YesL family protein [Oscillospiraceae bacterium]|nr:YesL family protein [Oscillospiraceae bacterium]
MSSIFSPDSKLMNMLGYVVDLFILNIIFLICCLPVFTIGAAQAGLYTATRQMIDPNDDRSVVKAFFRGFANGFGKISLVSTFFLLLDVILLYTLFMSIDYPQLGIHWLFPTVLLALCLLVHSLLPIFHFRFSCGAIQLVRNCLLLLIAHPLRSIAVMALTWAPAVLFFLNPQMFLDLGALFVMVYYSVAFLFGVFMMVKPFKQLIDDLDIDEEKEIEANE